VGAGQDRVRHDHVEAPGAFDRGSHEQVVVVPACRIGHDELGAAALLGDQLGGRATTLARDGAYVADDHVRTLSREGDRDRAADARRTPRDDRRLAGETTGAAQLSSPFASPPSISSVMPLM
jgi:hypothetical protein